MTVLVPNCAILSPATASLQDHFNALRDFFDATATSFSIVDEVESGGDYSALLVEQGGQQIEIDIDGTSIRCRVDPDGTRASLADAPSASASARVAHFSATTYASRAVVAEYPDAFLWLLEDSTGGFYAHGIHAGIVYTPFRTNDPALGISGHGMMGGIPRFTSSTGAGYWLSTTATVTTLVRVGAANWDRASELTASDTSVANMGGLLDGSLRLPPLVLLSRGAPANTGICRLGLTKYLAMAASLQPTKSIVPSTNSDQGYLYIRGLAGNGPFLALWDKTVTP